MGTQGQVTDDRWVMSYRITYSANGLKWTNYTEDNRQKVTGKFNLEGFSERVYILVQFRPPDSSFGRLQLCNLCVLRNTLAESNQLTN